MIHLFFAYWSALASKNAIRALTATPEQPIPAPERATGAKEDV